MNKYINMWGKNMEMMMAELKNKQFTIWKIYYHIESLTFQHHILKKKKNEQIS